MVESDGEVIKEKFEELKDKSRRASRKQKTFDDFETTFKRAKKVVEKGNDNSDESENSDEDIGSSLLTSTPKIKSIVEVTNPILKVPRDQGNCYQ